MRLLIAYFSTITNECLLVVISTDDVPIPVMTPDMGAAADVYTHMWHHVYAASPGWVAWNKHLSHSGLANQIPVYTIQSPQWLKPTTGWNITTTMGPLHLKLKMKANILQLEKEEAFYHIEWLGKRFIKWSPFANVSCSGRGSAVKLHSTRIRSLTKKKGDSLCVITLVFPCSLPRTPEAAHDCFPFWNNKSVLLLFL